MFRKLFLAGLLIAAAALLGVFWFNTEYYAYLPEHLPQHETVALGQDRFVPGSQAALRVIVRDSSSAQPLPDATINISLRASDGTLLPLYTGRTDRSGNAEVSFRVPDGVTTGQPLVIETTSVLGTDRVEKPIKTERDNRLLLTTDKPLYQPGQIIHLRTLALSAFDRQPAVNQSIDITIADGKGNKVFRKSLTTSDFGVASTDFQLATQVNTGAYKITAQLGTTTAEKTVEVKYYVLPKFASKWSTDRTFYQPGQHMRGTLSANYFFGKPVSDGTVTLEGYSYDVERKVALTLQGKTDARGNFEFEFDLPAYLTGSDLDQELARFYLQATVIDAQHSETFITSFTVSANPIVIRAIPESGQFRSGVENILYVLTSTPDGAPIETDLNIIVPNSDQTFTTTQSDRLPANTAVHRTITLPARSIPGTPAITVKIYPGVMSQVVEGLDSILRMPNGCFEQTSSTTYPNVLVLDYLRATNQAAPEVQLKAEQYINTGYQRLTTFEVPGGGFSLFGRVPADRMLTAYGLQEFGDMRRVHPIDEAMIQRAAEWLLSQQQPDGSWENDQGLVHESTLKNLQNNRLPVTAYIVWSLIEAGFGKEARTQQGLAYVREHRNEAGDAYVVALTANALVAADPNDARTQEVLDRLAELAEKHDDTVTWPSKIATFMGSTGPTGSIETTALATLALLRANAHIAIANGSLLALVQSKDPSGTWYTTQATILALKALQQSVRAGSDNVDTTITIKLDDGQAQTLKVTPENFDVVQAVTFNDFSAGRDHTVEIAASGEGGVMYQIAGDYVLPWSAVPRSSGNAEPVAIDVKYDRTRLSLSDTVNVSTTMRLNNPNGHVDSALIDLGVPPRFVVQSEDLDQLVAHYRDLPVDYKGARIELYELTGRQVTVYVTNLSGAEALDFSYRLKAKYPLSVQTPASAVYDYYNPDHAGEVRPLVLTVTQ